MGTGDFARRDSAGGIGRWDLQKTQRQSSFTSCNSRLSLWQIGFT